MISRPRPHTTKTTGTTRTGGDQDISNERVQLHVIETVLEKYQNLAAHLHDIESEVGDTVAAMDSLDSGDGRFGLLSATSTLHLFEARGAPDEEVTIEDVGPEDVTTQPTVTPEVTLGMGEGADLNSLGAATLLEVGRTP